ESLNPALAKRIAEETGARADLVLYGDTLGPAGSSGDTYLKMEQANAHAMATAFSGGRAGWAISGIGWGIAVRGGLPRRRLPRRADRPGGRELCGPGGDAGRGSRPQWRRQVDSAAHPARRPAPAGRQGCHRGTARLRAPDRPLTAPLSRVGSPPRPPVRPS